MVDKLDIIIIKLDKALEIAGYLAWFDKDVQQQITAYYHYADQLRAITSRILQYYYLTKILDINLSEVEFGKTVLHKPVFTKPEHIVDNISFNLSHSKDYVVLGIYQGQDYYLGIDIEPIDVSLEINEISAIVFSRSEQKLINQSHANFIKLWTKKEALIKARGTGFVTDYYQDTQLSLEDFEQTDAYIIATRKIEDYYLSICLCKRFS